MIKDTNFYNNDSKVYTDARYPKKSTSYVQFFFKKRLELFNGILDKMDKQGVKTILEIGCADGVVTPNIIQNFPNAKVVSVDISSGMIDAAKSKNIPNSNFYLRGTEPDQKYDLIIYLGVFNLTNRFEEIEFVKKHLDPNGELIISIAHSEAVHNFFRPYKSLFDHLLKDKEYKAFFAENFTYKIDAAYGLFIPYLWRLPFAESLQNFLENAVKKFSYKPFHEQIYSLKFKTL